MAGARWRPDAPQPRGGWDTVREALLPPHFSELLGLDLRPREVVSPGTSCAD